MTVLPGRNICMKIRMVLLLSGLLCSPLPAWAEHARIDLQVSQFDAASGRTKRANAFAGQEPPPGGNQARPLLKVKAGEALVLQFLFDNLYPHKVIPEARVRYFVVPVEKI